MRQTTLRATVAATVTAVLIALLPAPAQASPWVHIWLEHLPTGACLAIADSGDGAVPTQDPCVDTGYQLWTFEDTAVKGWYRLVNTATGKCLGANGFSAVHQLTCGTGTDQRWTLTGSGHSFRVGNVSAGGCLARQGISGIVLGSCTPSAALWSLLY